MNLALSLLSVLSLGSVSLSEPARSALRWELASIIVGVVILSFGLAGLAFFFLRRKTGDRSLLFFSLFALLYAIRLIFRQGLVRAGVAAPAAFWNYSELVVDNFIVLPLTLFLIEIVQGVWKTALGWVLAFQVAFATTRFLLQLFGIGARPREFVYHLVVVAYCLLLLVYPFSLARRGERMPREWKIVFGGLMLFGLFVIWSNLLGLARVSGYDFEPIGFLALVCCLGYVAASRTYANEQRLLSIQKELEIARQIQSAILPREVPSIAGLDIAARYLPMTAVAGDFYDFLVMDEQRVGILVADVTGHGVPAALIASMLKSALSAQAGHANDPDRVLSGLNRALCGKFEAHFVTAGYLFVDTEKQLLRYAGAGHPPLLFGSVDGGKPLAFREVEANGLMLGVLDEATYPAVELPFRPGDRCVLYTDGVLETKNAAEEEFGTSRFRSFLEIQASLMAAPLITASLAELGRWSGRGETAAREDDITLIAVDFARR
jgi:serine phosphatase RsbU (regulator of sigma subunit)